MHAGPAQDARNPKSPPPPKTPRISEDLLTMYAHSPVPSLHGINELTWPQGRIKWKQTADVPSKVLHAPEFKDLEISAKLSKLALSTKRV